MSEVCCVTVGIGVYRMARPEGVDQIPDSGHDDMTVLTDLDAWEVRGKEGADEWERCNIPIGATM